MLLFVLLVLGAILLFTIEMVVPGGVVGTLGFLCLVAAVVVAYTTFDTTIAHGVLITMVILSVVGFFVWARYFPESRLAKPFVSSQTVGEPDRSYRDLVGARGIAISDLRPAGTAELNGRRVDVVTEGDYVERGVDVEVIDAGGNRVVVRAAHEV